MDHAKHNTSPLDHTCDDITHADSTTTSDAPINQSDSGNAFPLTLARNGEWLRIAAFKAGKGLGKRLGDLGLHKGSEIKVIQRQKNGSLIVSNANNRFALGCGAAQIIVVTLITNRPEE